MAGSETKDETDEHAGEDGDDGLMDGTDTLDLEVVGRAEGEDEEEAEDTDTPPVEWLARSHGWWSSSCCGPGVCRNVRSVELLLAGVDFAVGGTCDGAGHDQSDLGGLGRWVLVVVVVRFEWKGVECC